MSIAVCKASSWLVVVNEVEEPRVWRSRACPELCALVLCLLECWNCCSLRGLGSGPRNLDHGRLLFLQPTGCRQPHCTSSTPAKPLPHARIQQMFLGRPSQMILRQCRLGGSCAGKQPGCRQPDCTGGPPVCLAASGRPRGPFRSAHNSAQPQDVTTHRLTAGRDREGAQQHPQ